MAEGFWLIKTSKDMFALNNSSKGHKSNLGDLEILLAPGNTDNGYAQYHAEYGVTKGKFPS